MDREIEGILVCLCSGLATVWMESTPFQTDRSFCALCFAVFLFMEEISQWKMGFMVICCLCVFDVVAILKNEGSEGQVFRKARAVLGL